jgi:hypothetical protein
LQTPPFSDASIIPQAGCKRKRSGIFSHEAGFAARTVTFAGTALNSAEN